MAKAAFSNLTVRRLFETAVVASHYEINEKGKTDPRETHWLCVFSYLCQKPDEMHQMKSLPEIFLSDLQRASGCTWVPAIER